MSTTTRRGTDNTSTPSRLVVTIAFAAVALFIVSEPYLIPWATPGMQLFQGGIMFAMWLLFMFGTTRR